MLQDNTLRYALQFCYHAANVCLSMAGTFSSIQYYTVLYSEVSHMNQYNSTADEC